MTADRNSIQFYYQPPSNEVFEEVKSKSLSIWSRYDDTYGYATSKKSQIENVDNSYGALMMIVGMFDFSNQIRLSQTLSIEAKVEIRDRLRAGGSPDYYNAFLTL